MKKAIAYFWILIVSIVLICPLFLTFVYSFSQSWDSIFPGKFTFLFYQTVFKDPAFIPSVFRGFIISFIPILLMNIAVVFPLYYSIIYSSVLERILQILCILPYSVQGVILATSILGLYSGSGIFLSNRILLLILAYCIIILPYIYQSIRNSFYTVNLKRLVEAGEILGATKLEILLKIVFPLLRPGLLVSTLLSMALIFGDFSIIKIIAGNQYQTAQMYLHNTRNMPNQIASAIVVIMFLITFFISNAILAFRENSRTSIRKGM